MEGYCFIFREIISTMKRLMIAILCLATGQGFSQGLPLSGQAQISVITLGPDQNELVQAFGHNAYRVVDPRLGIDYAYNYGVFSFNQPNFYLNFARGHNYYYVGVASYPDFIQAYIYYNRFIHEQVLDLTQDQKQRIFDYLQWNAQPENRSYLYDYFFNNCATKIRDVLTTVLKEEIQFDGSFIKTDYTIRELTDLYLKPLPWGDLGLDIGLGSPIDRKATPNEYMFLPDYIEYSFDHASLIHGDTKIPLVKSKKVVFASTPEPPQESLIHPWTAFGLLLVIGIALSIWDLRRKKISVWFDALLLGSSGLIGIILLLLWTATDHHACVKNYNMLWALPTHFLALIFLLRKNKPGWLRNYFLATGAIDLLLLLTWPILPQFLNYFLIPVVAALLVRSITLFKLLPEAKVTVNVDP